MVAKVVDGKKEQIFVSLIQQGCVGIRKYFIDWLRAVGKHANGRINVCATELESIFLLAIFFFSHNGAIIIIGIRQMKLCEKVKPLIGACRGPQSNYYNKFYDLDSRKSKCSWILNSKWASDQIGSGGARNL